MTLRRHSLDKNFLGAPAHVQTARQICLRDLCLRFEQGPDALNQFEVEILDAARLEPSVEGAALQGTRLRTQLAHVELLGGGFARLDHSLEPLCFIGGEHRGPPNGGAHIPIELLFDVGN